MIPDAQSKLAEALAELRASHKAQARALSAIEQALQTSLEQGLNALPETTAPISEHRRTHRPGPPPKIAGDPELQAFITARIDRMTFIEVAHEVALHFPKARRVGKSAIYDWWKKQQSRSNKDHRLLRTIRNNLRTAALFRFDCGLIGNTAV